MSEKPLRIVLTAGESSGDALGARLMRSLRQDSGRPVEFSGVGGPLMEAEGLASLFPMQDLSLMGIAEILPSLRRVLRRIRQTADFIIHSRPDIVITIDSPDFSFRVAKRVRRSSPLPSPSPPWGEGRGEGAASQKSDLGANGPLTLTLSPRGRGNKEVGPLMIHYVAPTVWAWRPERAAKVARLYDGLICLFPFEPDYFIREGMSAAFTGHPAIDSVQNLGAGMAFRRRHDIPEDAFALGLLFGSRRGEIERMGDVLVQSARRALDQAKPARPLHLIVPTLPHVKGEVEALLSLLAGGEEKVTTHLLTDPAEKWSAFAAMDSALAVSGTVGLELAVSGVPHVIAYKLKRLTYEIVRRKVKAKYAHLANLLLDQPVVPEFIQDDCMPERIAPELARLFNIDGAAATAQRTAFALLKSKLMGNGEASPSEQAGRYVLDLFNAKKS